MIKPTQWLVCVSVVIWLSLLGTRVEADPQGSNTGDGYISGDTTMPMESGVLDELIDILGRVDPSGAQAIRDATAPNGGTITVVRTTDPRFIGRHDSNTISLNPRNGLLGSYPPWMCAIALRHEYGHIQNIPPDAPPGSKDPTTDPKTNPSCASCNHAKMHADDLNLMASLSCDEEAPPCEEFCKQWCEAKRRGQGLWDNCQRYASSCPGLDVTQPFAAMVTNTPCCPCSC